MDLEAELLRGLERALPRVIAHADAGVRRVAQDMERDTRAGLERADPDAAVTVHRETEGSDQVISVDAEDAVFIEFGTQNNAAQPFMRPAIARAKATAEVTIGRQQL